MYVARRGHVALATACRLLVLLNATVFLAVFYKRFLCVCFFVFVFFKHGSHLTIIKVGCKLILLS